jgi:hypothetical protein
MDEWAIPVILVVEEKAGEDGASATFPPASWWQQISAGHS